MTERDGMGRGKGTRQNQQLGGSRGEQPDVAVAAALVVNPPEPLQSHALPGFSWAHVALEREQGTTR